jgi:hypothetical protein
MYSYLPALPEVATLEGFEVRMDGVSVSHEFLDDAKRSPYAAAPDPSWDEATVRDHWAVACLYRILPDTGILEQGATVHPMVTLKALDLPTWGVTHDGYSPTMTRHDA